MFCHYFHEHFSSEWNFCSFFCIFIPKKKRRKQTSYISKNMQKMKRSRNEAKKKKEISKSLFNVLGNEAKISKK
jgi:hypothetical protein